MPQNPWFQAIQKPAQEFPLTPLPIVSGQLPSHLRGTLYRNGPACLQRGGQKVGHWFDGDGAMLAVHFTSEGAKAVYRYVQTAGYQAEVEANQYLYPNYGMTVPGSFWKNWGKEVKNSANTSVLALEDKVLALWEGGLPYALDPTNLKTWGMDQLEGLSANSPFSAHPKIDPATGEIYNFGVLPGKESSLQVYQSTAKGKIVKTGSVKLKGIPLIHDFVLAGQYLVFLVSPVRVSLLPVLLGLKSFSDAMQWKPELGTEIIVLDRATLSVISRSRTEAWYQWHFANGYEEKDGTVVAQFIRYPDFQTNEYLKSIPTGHPKTNAEGNFWQLRLNPKTGKVFSNEPLLEQDCEFPVVTPQTVGQSQQETYLSVHQSGVDPQQELYGAIACYHHSTQTLTVAEAGHNRYPSEPIYVDDPEGSGWLLTVVYDANQDQSEVWIYQRDQLMVDPVCRLQLPQVIPHSFHGTWQPQKYHNL
ncbi:MAG: carotenoid oxygenase family protein [Halothece sp. Uz-M2-17]|nr:carotenoid oxygenase family protein [Halothece sp. Uz-M2-17]